MATSYLEKLQKQFGAPSAAEDLQKYLESERGAGYFRFMVDLILNSPSIAERKSQHWEYKSIADFASEEIAAGNPMEAIYDGAGLDRVLNLQYVNMGQFLKGVSKQFGDAIKSWLYHIPDGLDLYLRDEHGGYRVATEEDQSMRLVSMLIDNSIDIDAVMPTPPQWAIDLHLWRPNYDAYCAIFHDIDISDPLYEFSQRTRRDAVRAASRGRLGAMQGPADLPQELAIALEAFNAVYKNELLLDRKTPKQAISAWLKDRHPNLSEGALERIATVANWQPSGGAPRQA